jgi:peptidoglycan/xylan/chitin deacetylase (PgdA/CDA1 family)
MRKLACVSVNLDGLPHYCRVHGLDERTLPPAGATAVGRRATERFADLLDRRHLPGTFFAVGEDLEDGPSAMAIAEAARLGHEIGNHSHTHDFAVSRKPPALVANELGRAGDAIEALCGRRPAGFRAPGYAMSGTVLTALEEQGYLYDSSVFPSGPYYVAKELVVLGLAKLGRASASIRDRPSVLLAPREPYRPDPRDPYRRGSAKLIELPVATVPVNRLPFIGTFLVSLPKVVVASLYRRMRRRAFLNLEFHGIDLLDESDGASSELARAQRDLAIPAGVKRQRLAELLEWVRNDFEVVTLEEAAKRLAPDLR